MARRTTSTFHPFRRLPVEIRQYIWELSPKPRTILFGTNNSLHGPPKIRALFENGIQGDPSPAPTPAVLQACSESRSYLRRRATTPRTRGGGRRRAAAGGGSGGYRWINPALDTVRVGQRDLGLVAAQTPLARHVLAEGYGSEQFCRDGSALLDMAALRTLEIWHAEWGFGFEPCWCAHWCELMREYYDSEGQPVRFRTEVVYLDRAQFRLDRDTYADVYGEYKERLRFQEANQVDIEYDEDGEETRLIPW